MPKKKKNKFDKLKHAKNKSRSDPDVIESEKMRDDHEMVGAEKKQYKTDRERAEKIKEDHLRWRKYRDIIVTSLITIFLGSLVGEFLIRKNIENYNRQRAQFKNIDVESAESFSAILDSYNQIIKDRRSESQRISKYINDNNVVEFLENYRGYSETVDKWNNSLVEINKKITRSTRCETIRLGDKRRLSLDSKFDTALQLTLKNEKLINVLARPEFSDIKEKIYKEFHSRTFLCPTFFITRQSPYFADRLASGNLSIFSVHDKFREIHSRIYNFKTHRNTVCRYRHYKNMSDYYVSCTNIKLERERLQCFENYDNSERDGIFCEHIGFDSNKYKVTDVDIDELDIYWSLGNLYMIQFKTEYMINYCEDKLDFWGKVLGWDCRKKIVAAK